MDLAIGLMRAVMPLAERAARLPAGPSNPHCNAGMSFTALRDAGSLPRGVAARRLFVERCAQLAEAGRDWPPRVRRARRPPRSSSRDSRAAPRAALT